MGTLIDLYGGQKKHKEKISKCLSIMENSHEIFKTGEKQADKIIVSIGKLLNLSLFNLDEKEYFNLLNIYADIYELKENLNYEYADLKTFIKEKYSSYFENKEIQMEMVVNYCILNTMDNTFFIDTNKDLKIISAIPEILEESMNGGDYENYNQEDENFGLNVNSPIPCKGINEAYDYLDRLKTDSNMELYYKRTGSFEIESSDYLIDEFITYTKDNKEYKKIYLNIYSKETTKKAPKGFILKEK